MFQKRKKKGKEKKERHCCFSDVKLHWVLTSSQSTKPAILPPLAQMLSTTLNTLLFTLHLVLPSISRACTFRTEIGQQLHDEEKVKTKSQVKEALLIRSKLRSCMMHRERVCCI